MPVHTVQKRSQWAATELAQAMVLDLTIVHDRQIEGNLFIEGGIRWKRFWLN